MSDLLTKEEAAAELQVSVRTLTRMMAAGQIAFVKRGNRSGRVFFKRRHLDDYLTYVERVRPGASIVSKAERRAARRSA